MTPQPLELLLFASEHSDGRVCQQALANAAFKFNLAVARSVAEFSEFQADKQFDAILISESTTSWNAAVASERFFPKGADLWWILLTTPAPASVARIAFCERTGASTVPKDSLALLPSLLEKVLETKALRQQQERLEAELRHSRRMQSVGRLAAGVAHDFNNILTVIQGHTGLLRSQPKLPPEARESLQEVARAVERATGLVRQLLPFTRQHAWHPQRLDLNQTLTGLSGLLHRVLGADIQLQLDCGPDLLPIEADRGLLEQLVLELALNARDAMPCGGQFIMSTRVVHTDPLYLQNQPDARVGIFLCLSAIDSGLGRESRSGDPSLVKVSKCGNEPAPGNQPLLALFDIVQRHQGWIEAGGPAGYSSPCKIFLPVAPAQKLTSNPPTGVSHEGDETVLVVEDEPPVRWITRNILEHHGYRVLEAGSGIEALAVWHQHQKEIAVLLTDMVMPVGVSGEELARQFQREKPALKVIYTSGYSPRAAASDLDLVPEINFLQKPCDAQTLTSAIRGCLDRAVV